MCDTIYAVQTLISHKDAQEKKIVQIQIKEIKTEKSMQVALAHQMTVKKLTMLEN